MNIESNLRKALDVAKKSMDDTKELVLSPNQSISSYKEFIEEVYEGDSKQFKEDLEYDLRKNSVDITDNMEILNGDEYISYRSFVGLLKKELKI